MEGREVQEGVDMYIHISAYVCVCACAAYQDTSVRLFVTLWTVAHQVPLSMGLSRQEYWNGFYLSCVSCLGR